MPRARIPSHIRRREKQWVFDLAKGEYGRRSRCYKIAISKVLKKLDNQRRFRKHFMATLHHQAFVARLRWATNENGMHYDDFCRQLNKNNVFVDKKTFQHLSIYEPLSFKAVVEVAKSLNDYYGCQNDYLKKPILINREGNALGYEQLAQLKATFTNSDNSDIIFKEGLLDNYIDWARKESNRRNRDMAVADEDLTQLVYNASAMSIDDNTNNQKTFILIKDNTNQNHHQTPITNDDNKDNLDSIENSNLDNDALVIETILNTNHTESTVDNNDSDDKSNKN